MKLKFRNVTITQRIYAGWDTEYKNLDISITNVKPLTHQIASTASVDITVPKITEYKPIGVNTVSSEEYIINKYPKGLEIKRIVDWVDEYTRNIRKSLYGDKDMVLLSIIKYLKNKGIIHHET